MRKKKLHLILHGKSAQNPAVRSAVEAVRADGASVSVAVTWEAGDTQRFTRQAIEKARNGALDTVVAGGGDGTLNEVISTALEEDAHPPCSFGLLPLGTANDFAHGARCAVGAWEKTDSEAISIDDLTGALRKCLTAPAREIDVGQVNGRVFVNLVTGGMGTRITVETDPFAKKVLGGAAYLVSGLGRLGELRTLHARFTAESFDWSGEIIAMAIGNGRRAGGGIELCPEALIDDGLLDLTIIPAVESGGMPAIVEAVLQHGLDGLREQVVSAQVKDIQIECPQELSLNLDGEPMSGERFEVAIRPKAIRFHL